MSFNNLLLEIYSHTNKKTCAIWLLYLTRVIFPISVEFPHSVQFLAGIKRFFFVRRIKTFAAKQVWPLWWHELNFLKGILSLNNLFQSHYFCVRVNEMMFHFVTKIFHFTYFFVYSFVLLNSSLAPSLFGHVSGCELPGRYMYFKKKRKRKKEISHSISQHSTCWSNMSRPVVLILMLNIVCASSQRKLMCGLLL